MVKQKNYSVFLANFMDTELTKEVDVLADWVVSRIVEDSSELIKSVKCGLFDYADEKMQMRESLTGQISHELLFMYLHLLDMYAYQILGEKRGEFMNYLI